MIVAKISRLHFERARKEVNRLKVFAFSMAAAGGGEQSVPQPALDGLRRTRRLQIL
jgi:hypothetical protein